MKIMFGLWFILFATQVFAQERFIDSLFDIEEPITETYSVKDGEALKMDIYRPSQDTMKARPLIVFMHGGGFSGGSRTNNTLVKFAEAAAAKGYIAVQISYRLTRKGQTFGCDYEAKGKIETFQLAAEDFMDALNFLLKNKDIYRINPSQIIVGGSSAGAEAVLNAVYNERLMFKDLTPYKDIEIAGVFSLAGAILDTRYITSPNAVPGVFFHGIEDNLVPYGTGPHHWCNRDKPGYLILDGSLSIVERLRELETSYLLYSFTGGKHEHSGVPFEHLPQVFSFFRDVFINNEKYQIAIVE